MKLSRKFLSDYVDITDIKTEDLAEKMVFAGNEYDSIESLGNASSCVIGKVVTCKDHPESDHLHICTVDYGEGEKTIVCGAPNVKAGIKVIIAKIGAVLPNGEIKAATLAGIPSEGMICALDELGVSSKYNKEEEERGIFVAPEDAPIGADALSYLELDDEIIDFELTANRADLMNIIGMAYEVGAIYDRDIHIKESTYTEVGNEIEEEIDLSVETDACSIYLGKMVKDVEIKESPTFIKNRLMASGIRPINNVVDISNYVMLEYGNPLHFFDKDALGNHVVVRMAKEGETVTTLDKNERTLTEEDIVIANEKEPICLAGVMGGLSTEVEPHTKNLFIEAAIFDSVKIRRTSNKILRSESSTRYEKGVDPARTRKAMDRALELLETYANGKVGKGMLVHDKTNKEDKKIVISLEKINKVLGLSLEVEEVENCFRRLQFKTEVTDAVFTVSVPTRRLDVDEPCDLIEEVGRIHGYENLKGTMPILPLKRGEYSPKRRFEDSVRSHLMALGLHQVRTYSLIAEKESTLFPFRNEEKISILAPLTEDRKVLRTSLIPSHLSVFDYNIARNNKDVSIFEVASSYYKIEGNYIEEAMVAGLISGNLVHNSWNHTNVKADFYSVKGIVTNLLDYMGLAGRYTFMDENMLSTMHPYRSTYIKVDNEIVGYMGAVHPKICKKEVYVFEMSLDQIRSKKIRGIKYKEVSKYPVVHKDLAFVINKDVSSETIMKVLKKVGGRLLNDITVFDVYTGENVGKDEKSIAYSLTFGDMNRTLQDEEVTTIFHKMITEVENQCNAKLRSE
ncbi:MAG: phenylalanine--tRNA ligase subunit beta [Bacilli bacterium]|nr:phenylalanine--tRNA ligase subunit beta [Bacilli bacterium]